ncbi:MAG: zinc-binding dehydrogenase [Candidatus Omnitrophota bacterium]|jgi:NADPH:quinone reductase-like Zn-dependent oxidoreductase
MSKMRAVIFREHGDTDRLEYTYVPKPKPGKHEVLVKVEACALNHLDLWVLAGVPGVKIQMPHIPGCDIAGEVVEAGARVRGIPLGKPVLVSPGIVPRKTPQELLGLWDSLCDGYKINGFQANGGLAEYIAVPDRNVLPVSNRLSYEEWASIPLVFLTAWHMLVTRAGLRKKETVLIHAAGSGVGSAAIQVAKYLGAEVLTTIGSDEKIKRAKELGADHVIHYGKSDFAAEALKITHGKGVDVVFEHIGPATFQKSLACLAKRGRLVTCGVTSGPTVHLDLRFVFSRQISILGSYMGGLKELREVVRLVEAKKLKPVIDKVFPLRQAKEAFERMKARRNFGKIILTPA